jgi:hypothetical protein
VGSEITETVLSFGLNLLGAVLIVAFNNYLSSRPASEVGGAAVSVIVLGGVGLALGAASVLLRNTLADVGIPFGTAGAEAVLVLACLGLALFRPRSQAGVLSYLLDVFALWVPFIAVWLGLNNVEAFARNFLPVAAGLFLVCAAIGALLVLVRKRSLA